MTVYVAPAAEPLTCLHVVHVPTVPGADGKPVDVPDAVTVCGVHMDPGGLWTRIDPRPGDRLCADCASIAAPEGPP